MNTRKAIIFDADGMIVHGERFSSRLARDYAIPLKVTDSFFQKEFQDSLIGKLDLREVLPPYLKVWKWDGGIDDLLDYWFSAEYNIIDKRFASIITKLRKQGIKTYLATNNERYRTDNLIKDRGLEKWFDDVFSSAYIGAKKPEAIFFQAIIDKTGLKKEEIEFWDDDVQNTQGATKFGFQVEVYNDFQNFEKKMNQLLK